MAQKHWRERTALAATAAGLFLLIALNVPTEYGRNDPLIMLLAVVIALVALLVIRDETIRRVTDWVVTGFHLPMSPVHRVLVAIFLTCICVTVYVELACDLRALDEWPEVFLGALLLLSVPSMLGALLVFHLVTRLFGPQPETRCRRCHVALRNITEPQCPECGERI